MVVDAEGGIDAGCGRISIKILARFIYLAEGNKRKTKDYQ